MIIKAVFLKSDNLIKKEIAPGAIALIIIAICNTVAFISTKEDLVSLTREDGIVEYTAMACYLVSAVALFFLSAKAKKVNCTNFQGSLSHIVFLVLAFTMILFAGEEISWGQRIFDFNMPDYWENANRQGEANLHNLNYWEALDTSGIEKQGIVRLFSSVALYSYFSFFLLLVIPIINKYWSVTTGFFLTKGIPVFSFFYGVLFLVNFFVLEIIERTGIESRPVGEIKETNFAILYLAASISMLIKSGPSPLPTMDRKPGIMPMN